MNNESFTFGSIKVLQAGCDFSATFTYNAGQNLQQLGNAGSLKDLLYNIIREQDRAQAAKPILREALNRLLVIAEGASWDFQKTKIACLRAEADDLESKLS